MKYSPQRIVSLQPSVTVTLAAIGRLDALVACTKYCADVCPEVKQRGCLIVSDSWTAHAEEIAASRPDLVIASVPYQEKSVIEILKTGTAFLGFAPKCLDDVYKDIAAIAGIVGEAERGERVIAEMQEQIGDIRRQTASQHRPRVFCEEWGKPLITSQQWVLELVEAAGGEFVGTPGAQTTAEAVLAADPDVVVAAWCGAGDRVPLKKIARDRNWSNMRAVREGRVFCIRDEYLNTPAPTLVKGLRALAGAIHPRCFSQVDGLICIRDVGPQERATRPAKT
jgi:iron complex transport system substrate-binding protein